jgi:hypothetical protein
MLFGLIGLVLSFVAAFIGFSQARAFVRDRLRYVDAAQSSFAPFVSAVGALLIAAPVVALLPIVGAGTAIAFGLSVGVGVANGQRDIRRALPPGA